MTEVAFEGEKCFNSQFEEKEGEEKGWKGRGTEGGESPSQGKTQWQEPEAAGHMTLAVRRLRETDDGTQFTFSFLFSLGSQPRGWCRPQ